MSVAVHGSETSLHAHMRLSFEVKGKNGWEVNQEKCLEKLGYKLPDESPVWNANGIARQATVPVLAKSFHALASMRGCSSVRNTCDFLNIFDSSYFRFHSVIWGISFFT